ncbi:MAG TPA: hypothetical protein VER32_04180 [Pyrinomonadaceae bacterium]|nr:hypothetical protein [Pyrinomonadaceae bacterium]
MSEQTTQSLNGGDSFETRVLAEFVNLNNRMTSFEARLGSIDARLTALGEKVETRLHDTRPIWEAVLERLEKVETRLEKVGTKLDHVDTKLDVLGLDLLDTRADVENLKKRVPPAA